MAGFNIEQLQAMKKQADNIAIQNWLKKVQGSYKDQGTFNRVLGWATNLWKMTGDPLAHAVDLTTDYFGNTSKFDYSGAPDVAYGQETIDSTIENVRNMNRDIQKSKELNAIKGLAEWGFDTEAGQNLTSKIGKKIGGKLDIDSKAIETFNKGKEYLSKLYDSWDVEDFSKGSSLRDRINR